MKVGFYTLGCKVNSYESEFAMSLFKEKEYEICNFDDICDVYVINTCTVTNQSDSKSRKIINQAIRRNEKACIVAMGCFIEANKNQNFDGVDIAIGNKDKSKIVELVEEWLKKHQKINDLYDDLGYEFEDMYITHYDGRTRAFVKIQDGCNNFCSYCIIPYVRGRCRSKDYDTVLKEIKALVENDYKEIVLTGIHTGSYGRDIGRSFGELLKDILKIKGLYRLRISSIEITELTDEVLDLLKNNNIIAEHLHVPLQAGSNDILRLMNRKYDLDYYRKKIKEIRSIKPNISISTDIIVGFPGETEEMFLSTIEFAKEMKFSKIHVFPYSERKNTYAMKLPNHLENALKKERARKLIEVSKDLEIKYMKQFIGQSVDVLIETNDGINSYGHTSNYLHVLVPGKYNSEDIISVEIKDIKYPYVVGNN